MSLTGERVKIGNDAAVAVDLYPNHGPPALQRLLGAFKSFDKASQAFQGSVDPGTIIVARLDRFHLTRLCRHVFWSLQ